MPSKVPILLSRHFSKLNITKQLQTCFRVVTCRNSGIHGHLEQSFFYPCPPLKDTKFPKKGIDRVVFQLLKMRGIFAIIII